MILRSFPPSWPSRSTLRVVYFVLKSSSRESLKILMHTQDKNWA